MEWGLKRHKKGCLPHGASTVGFGYCDTVGQKCRKNRSFYSITFLDKILLIYAIGNLSQIPTVIQISGVNCGIVTL